MMYRFIIFDLDGTVINTSRVVYDIEQRIVKELGGKPQSFDDFRNVQPMTDWHEHYRRLGIKETQKAIDLFYLYEQQITSLQPIEGTQEILEYLDDKKIPFVILTHNISKENPLKKIRLAGLDRIISEGQVYHTHQRKTRHIRNLCESYSVDADTTLFVSDTHRDMIDGNEVPVHTVGIVNNTSFDTPEYIKKFARTTITDIRELKEIV